MVAFAASVILAFSAMVMSQPNEKASVADENSQNLKPWSQRWEEKKIGFHLSDVNPVLTKFADDLLKPASSDENSSEQVEGDCSATRVFVPLCGKTLDMVYLANRAGDVYGVEGIKTALEEFAVEHPELKITNNGVKDGFEHFEGEKISLLKGDFFALTTDQTEGHFDAVYDRGSLVAIDPSLRDEYIKVLQRLLAKGARILLVTYERIGSEESTKMGPPFSIPESGVREIYEGLDWVESVTLLHKEDQFLLFPELKERTPGLEKLLETVYLIRAKK